MRGEATDIARKASAQTVVAVGGDGTVHEVANGLFGSDKVLGVLPIGSGNDFVKSIGMPTQLDSAVEALISHRVSSIDLGVVEILGKNGVSATGESGASYFVNGLGVGFDAAVAVRTQRIPMVSGTLVYVLAVLQTLGQYVAPEFRVSVDERETKSRNLLIAVGNGRCAGGGFYLTPDAVVTDGKLDVCIVEDMSTLAILRLMRLVMKGKHHSINAVKFDRGQTITIKSSEPVAVHADGEILGEEISGLRIEVIPRAVKVIVGQTDNQIRCIM